MSAPAKQAKLILNFQNHKGQTELLNNTYITKWRLSKWDWAEHLTDIYFCKKTMYRQLSLFVFKSLKCKKMQLVCNLFYVIFPVCLEIMQYILDLFTYSFAKSLFFLSVWSLLFSAFLSSLLQFSASCLYGMVAQWTWLKGYFSCCCCQRFSLLPSLICPQSVFWCFSSVKFTRLVVN